MNTLFALFGDDPLPAMQRWSRNTINAWIVVGAILLVVALVFVWAAFVRKRRRRVRRHHYQRRSIARAAADGMSAIRQHVHERQRRRRSRQRPRNPTLAETGGLPPARSEAPPSQPS
jgi:type VI protein secretion system component VasK